MVLLSYRSWTERDKDGDTETEKLRDIRSLVQAGSWAAEKAGSFSVITFKDLGERDGQGQGANTGIGESMF